MGIFLEEGSVQASIDQSFAHPERIVESFIVDEVAQLPTEKIQEFCQPGGVGEQLVQEGKLRRNTLVRLSKKDDLERRSSMMNIQLAKENNDPLWKKLVKNRQQKHQLIDAIDKKYGAKGERLAKKAQNEFLHGGAKKTGVLPKSFMRAGGEDR